MKSRILWDNFLVLCVFFVATMAVGLWAHRPMAAFVIYALGMAGPVVLVKLERLS